MTPEPIEAVIARLRLSISPDAACIDSSVQVEIADLSRLLDYVEEMRGMSYLIWSNERRAWWRSNSQGYTVHLAAAGRYSRTEALLICSRAHDGWEEGKAPPEVPIKEGDALQCALPPPPVKGETTWTKP